MVNITREDIIKIAKISCLEVEEHELEALRVEIQAVLTYVSSLQDVVKAYELAPKADIPHNINITRQDISRPYDVERIMQAAPEREENYFVVPLIVK